MRTHVVLSAGVIVAAACGPLCASQPAAPKKDEKAPAIEAAGASLRVGSAAPPISVDAWVKGEPVKAFEKGRVYVVEFWATWCGPCIQSIPHLTELQARYKDKVAVIGVAASEEKTAGSDQRLTKLQQFVRTRGEQMGYTVAFDGDRDMGRAWMEAARQGGIPCSFVVGHDGKIAYIGHPLGMDAKLASAVAAAEKAAKAEAAAPKTGTPATKPAAEAKPGTDAKPADKPPAKSGR